MFGAHSSLEFRSLTSLQNAAESFYGRALWDCFYSLLDGDETSRWDDALLTSQGEDEARKAAAAWKTQRKFGVPLPESYLSSPLR